MPPRTYQSRHKGGQVRVQAGESVAASNSDPRKRVWVAR